MDQFPFPWARTPNENTMLSTSADGNYFDEALSAESTTAPLVAPSSSWWYGDIPMYQNVASVSSFPSAPSLQPEPSVYPPATYQPEPWYHSAPDFQSGPSYQPASCSHPAPSIHPASRVYPTPPYQPEQWYQPATNFLTGPSFHQPAMQVANPASVQHTTSRYANLGQFHHPLNALRTQETQHNSSMSAPAVGNAGFDFGLPLTGNGNARRARPSSLTSDAIGRVANIRHHSTGCRD
ncbi:hypothetical protein BO83DRAFT_427888 [Aspergillus eucalypticola CBS 122712]|uniref:Uncharacterized protein n=1 Tax=Aspergillus eucalypticola (strain CBS 122712 / IBT 29274) TaxID=1448314 RepID=A0A317VAP1_ASPEC|nr:uncharacterized protein BO83DRAFT_427888 [Aspergillus eucalypticola CBS 122712]PWY71276.1 hypothetical protein BO83DRAFT_427888 [Aspergillus eucalypticola CBS 122712]